MRKLKGHKIGESELAIPCYTDDGVLIAENEDGLRRLVLQFNKVVSVFNVTICASKTKWMTSKAPNNCKIVINYHIIK